MLSAALILQVAENSGQTREGIGARALWNCPVPAGGRRVSGRSGGSVIGRRLLGTGWWV